MTGDRCRVALVTCAQLPDLDPDDRRLVDPLRALGVAAVPAVWDDPAVDWSAFDLVLLRSTWDYPPRRAEFLAWAASVPRLVNPAGVVGWNTDKRYLAELAAAGVPVVPTGWLPPGQPWRPGRSGAHPGEPGGDWVVKPAVGAGSLDCGRYHLGDPVQRRMAEAHVARLHRAGRTVMVQPYLAAVDAHGETGVVFLPATGPHRTSADRNRLAVSHAIRKAPMLDGPDPGTGCLYRSERITRRVPTAAELAVARQALDAVPGGTGNLLYARVDLIPGPDRTPVLVELELTEPSLFLAHAPGVADRLAAAVAARLARGSGSPACGRAETVARTPSWH
jgi:hypothetical protein